MAINYCILDLALCLQQQQSKKEDDGVWIIGTPYDLEKVERNKREKRFFTICETMTKKEARKYNCYAYAIDMKESPTLDTVFKKLEAMGYKDDKRYNNPKIEPGVTKMVFYGEKVGEAIFYYHVAVQKENIWKCKCGGGPVISFQKATDIEYYYGKIVKVYSKEIKKRK